MDLPPPLCIHDHSAVAVTVEGCKNIVVFICDLEMPSLLFPDTGVTAVFSGHYHRNAGGCHEGLDMVVSSAIGCQLGKDTHGVRVVIVTADTVHHRYYSLEQLRVGGMDEDLSKLLRSSRKCVWENLVFYWYLIEFCFVAHIPQWSVWAWYENICHVFVKIF